MSVEAIGFGAGMLYCNQAQMGQRPQMDPEKAAEGFLNMKDTDGDGYLSTDEVSLSEELFATVDADGDGVLSSSEIGDNMESILEELKANGEMPPPPPPPMMDPEEAANGLLNMMDEDGDGYLSTDEISISEELFSTADADGDGLLSSSEIADNMESIGEELRANGEMPPPPPPPPMMKDSDDLTAMTGLSSDMLSGLFSMIGEEE